MNPQQLFHEAMCQTPEDWLFRAIVADWFEETGQTEIADCLRWMAVYKKRPYRSPSGDYHWYDARRISSKEDPESNVPTEVYQFLSGKIGAWCIHRTYDSFGAAEVDFYTAWELARARGWSERAS